MTIFFEIVFWVLVCLLYVGAMYSCVAGVHISFSPIKRIITLTLLLAGAILLYFVPVNDFSQFVRILLVVGKGSYYALYGILCFSTFFNFIED